MTESLTVEPIPAPARLGLLATLHCEPKTAKIPRPHSPTPREPIFHPRAFVSI